MNKSEELIKSEIHESYKNICTPRSKDKLKSKNLIKMIKKGPDSDLKCRCFD